MLKVNVENLGPLKKGELELNDITIIAGKNNSGKTYLSYVIYSFLNYVKARLDLPLLYGPLRKQRADIVKLYYDIIESHYDIINKSEKNGISTLNKEQSKKLLDDVKKHICGYHAHNLHKFFNTERRYFNNVSLDIDSNTKKKVKHRRIEIKYEKGQLSFMKVLSPQYHSRDILSGLIKMLYPINSFIMTAERFGISLFCKDLDTAKNRIVETLQQMGTTSKKERLSPYHFLDMHASRYAKSIQDNIDFVRYIGDDQGNKKAGIDSKALYDYIKDMIEGYYIANEHEIRFVSKKRKENSFNIPIHLGSSLARGMLIMYYYLKHHAREGDLIIIDEPESHLDSENQLRMVRLLAMCVKAGLKVLLTTQSDYIIREINNLIKLSQPFDDKDAFCRKHDYNETMFLRKNQVNGYICENGTLRKCESDKYGIDIDSFDETISQMNKISRHLTVAVAHEDREKEEA